ncbi:reverse transcriptase [Plakobranchus ocellatus]|uniref:Reverse transcriptase n=1 Tax=Plakobranchus ocellatus TaxID=259542 RepID=A0AAV4D5D2_9GAST|nr:reverse transcriptase [Plakobranchus ocellatus]
MESAEMFLERVRDLHRCCARQAPSLRLLGSGQHPSHSPVALDGLVTNASSSVTVQLTQRVIHQTVPVAVDVIHNGLDQHVSTINFPPASSGKQWEDLDSKIVLKIDSLLGKSTLEHKLATFGDIVYQTCLDTFGAKQHQTKCPPQRSRRQLEMDTLRKQKRKLKKQIKAARSEETNGLLAIWRQLKRRHSALSRAESARKKRSQKRKKQERFIRDPFQFARQLFQQSKAKSAPGPNGVPYLLYKRCPNVLKKLH